MSKSGRDKFHAHLDECEQCRDHPLALCVVGSELLKSAVVVPEWERGGEA